MEHSPKSLCPFKIFQKMMKEYRIVSNQIKSSYHWLNIVIYIVSRTEYRVSYRIVRLVYHYSPSEESGDQNLNQG